MGKIFKKVQYTRVSEKKEKHLKKAKSKKSKGKSIKPKSNSIQVKKLQKMEFLFFQD
jgi:hypothetical protein